MPGQAFYPDLNKPISDNDQLVADIVHMVKKTNLTASPPAHLSPIVWSEPVDLSARVSVPAAVGVYTSAITFTVPEGRYARLKYYGVNVIDPAYTYNGSLLWRFIVNGNPLGDGMSDWGIQRGSVIQPRETYIILKQEDVLGFQVRRAVAAGAAQDVDMSITGWTWRLRMNYEGTGASVTAF
jgi:hypothetical protein